MSKTVFTGSEIAHVWANKGAPTGRTSGTNPGPSFEGDAFYSWRACIGRRISHKGKTAYVIDNATFSSRTSKHQSKVRAAIRDADMVFSVSLGGWTQDLMFTPASLRDYYLAEYRKPAEHSPYAHVRAKRVLARDMSLQHAIHVCVHFGLPYKTLAKEQAKIASSVSEARDIAQTHDVEQAERREKRQANRDVLRIKRDASKMQEWLSGLPVYPSHHWPTLLRAEGGDTILDVTEMVTSRGARVPLSDAKRAFTFCQRLRAKGWRRNGETFKVGMYQIDSISEAGIVAGCHTLKWNEVERFARQMGWMPAV